MYAKLAQGTDEVVGTLAQVSPSEFRGNLTRPSVLTRAGVTRGLGDGTSVPEPVLGTRAHESSSFAYALSTIRARIRFTKIQS